MQKFKTAFILMRIPFSLFLMPIFCLAIVGVFILNNSELNLVNAFLLFVILHLFVYPASNGYNSYFDKDEGSIGGLEKPPKINIQLFYLVVLFDVVAVLLSFLISVELALMVLLYILVSKAYSWQHIRLKRWAIISTIVVAFFQGFFVYLMVHYAVFDDFNWQLNNVLLALTSTLFLAGSYPITQVYQHQEDSKRGDKTLSLMLGIKGTFVFSGVMFAFATLLMSYSFILMGRIENIIIFLLATTPVLWFFLKWQIKVFKNPAEANFKNTMQMNKISSLCMTLGFIVMIILAVV